MDIQKQQTTPQTRTTTDDEPQVREVLNRYVTAFRAGNIDDLMKLYTEDAVAFDMMAPLQIVGRDRYRKAWEKGASMMGTPWVYTPRDLRIVAGSDVAFAHAIVECGGTSKEGKIESGWVRHTLGFRKVDGKWLIAHEQFSVPIDFKDGKAQACMELKPEEVVH
ncbi:MAG TPA: SgcJ/EcaC family oxidoreductase [Bdellovibrionales bacterium]|nr:SgcJ/EcaC family oxidoreductase [Bdellovibrionales bacterium]